MVDTKEHELEDLFRNDTDDRTRDRTDQENIEVFQELHVDDMLLLHAEHTVHTELFLPLLDDETADADQEEKGDDIHDRNTDDHDLLERRATLDHAQVFIFCDRRNDIGDRYHDQTRYDVWYIYDLILAERIGRKTSIDMSHLFVPPHLLIYCTKAATHKSRKRIRDPSIELAVGLISTVDLMVDDTILDEKNSSCGTCRLDGMGDHEDGLAVFIDGGKLIEKFIGGTGIKSTGRFVRKDHLRFCDDRAGDRYTLLLTAGDLVRELFEKRRDPELIGDRTDPRLHLLRRAAGKNERQIDVISYREIIEKIEFLENKAEAFSSELGQKFLLHGLHALAFENDFSFCGFIQRGEDVQKGRFA